MSDEAHGVWSGIECPDAVWLQGIAKLYGIHAGIFAIEDDNIADNVFGIDVQQFDLRDALSQSLRVLMINEQALGRFFEGDSACGGEYADLAHSAAKHLAVDASLFDESVRTDNHRANRRAKSFRKPEHHRIETLRDFRDIHTQRDRSLENLSTVQRNLTA